MRKKKRVLVWEEPVKDSMQGCPFEAVRGWLGGWVEWKTWRRKKRHLLVGRATGTSFKGGKREELCLSHACTTIGARAEALSHSSSTILPGAISAAKESSDGSPPFPPPHEIPYSSSMYAVKQAPFLPLPPPPSHPSHPPTSTNRKCSL